MTKPLNEREAALDLLLEITEHGEYSHTALRKVLDKYQYLDKRERAFITRVTEGTLEHMIEIDYILGRFSDVEVKKMKPVIRGILRSAVYQLKYMDSVPKHAVCNEAVKLAERKGFGRLKGFVNGVLRNTARRLDDIPYPSGTEEYLSVRYSMPVWIIRLFLKSYDIGTVTLMLEDFQKEKPLTVRCNTSKVTPAELAERFAAEKVGFEAHPYLPYAFKISGFDYLGALESFKEGLFAVQDISSMMVGAAAAPKSGDYVIDVCASPGGKSIHIADLLKGTGHVEARDLTEYKVNLIKENIERTGFTNISACIRDALTTDEASAGKADIVLADLPCSGLGVLGKKPDLKYKITEQQVKELAVLQERMLDVVCDYVKPGGTFIYSTCTVNEEENEKNVIKFLNKHQNFALEEIKNRVCGALKGSIVSGGCLKLLPGVNDSDGFFIAKMRRIHD